uniref:ZP domain-containing protein n=1 Tax=Parastrongyloides trichosuri TaxID=131310 RepID=A0A0N4Z8B5_PARTI
MVSKAAFFTAVIILNLIDFNWAVNFIISGTIRCNGSVLPGATVSLCDGEHTENPIETLTSDSNGQVILRADLKSSDSIYRVSIYHNCTSTTSKGSEEKIYTKRITYKDSGMGQTQQSKGVQAPLNLKDLLKVEYNYNYLNCSKNK